MFNIDIKYIELFNKLTDILLDIQKIQQSMEEIYIENAGKLTAM